MCGWGQTLSITRGTGAPGGVASLVLSLQFPSGRQPVALQWELSYPAAQLGTGDNDLQPAQAATASGKSLTCAGRPKDAGTYLYRCILAGGKAGIGMGAIATVKFQIRARARSGAAAVRVSNAVAVYPDGKQSKLEPVQADVTIR